MKGGEPLETIKELLEEVTLFVRTLHAMALELEKVDKRLYSLEENRKAKDATIVQLQQEIATLKILARKKAECK